MRKLVLAAALALPAIAGALPVAAEGFGPVHVAVNRHEYRGRACPVEVVFTATIDFNLPHPRGFTFNYHWERSDGAKSASHVVRPRPGERSMVVREKWRVGGRGQSYDISQTIHLGSGNEHIRESSPTVHIECH
ncbi:MAG TPA: hypothetical protein VH040_03780 [Usitatibacter sp.]|jgi:hypothetical protein|nr:hypothetical protein [Usitatibacter sp.]